MGALLDLFDAVVSCVDADCRAGRKRRTAEKQRAERSHCGDGEYLGCLHVILHAGGSRVEDDANVGHLVDSRVHLDTRCGVSMRCIWTVFKSGPSPRAARVLAAAPGCKRGQKVRHRVHIGQEIRGHALSLTAANTHIARAEYGLGVLIGEVIADKQRGFGVE